MEEMRKLSIFSLLTDVWMQFPDDWASALILFGEIDQGR